MKKYIFIVSIFVSFLISFGCSLTASADGLLAPSGTGNSLAIKIELASQNPSPEILEELIEELKKYDIAGSKNPTMVLKGLILCLVHGTIFTHLKAKRILESANLNDLEDPEETINFLLTYSGTKNTLLRSALLKILGTATLNETKKFAEILKFFLASTLDDHQLVRTPAENGLNNFDYDSFTDQTEISVIFHDYLKNNPHIDIPLVNKYQLLRTICAKRLCETDLNKTRKPEIVVEGLFIALIDRSNNVGEIAKSGLTTDNLGKASDSQPVADYLITALTNEKHPVTRQVAATCMTAVNANSTVLNKILKNLFFSLLDPNPFVREEAGKSLDYFVSKKPSEAANIFLTQSTAKKLAVRNLAIIWLNKIDANKIDNLALIPHANATLTRWRFNNAISHINRNEQHHQYLNLSH